MQQYTSFDFYENMLNYAIRKGHLTFELTRDNWGTDKFQFYAGDLFDIIPRLKERYQASEAVSGQCRPDTGQSSSVSMFTSSTFRVTIKYQCEIGIGGDKISQIGLGFVLEIAGYPEANA
jgi:hypothetical protein